MTMIGRAQTSGKTFRTTLRSMMALAGLGLAGQALGQVTLYEHDGFQGRQFTTQKQVGSLERAGFNDRASSVLVTSGRWEVCEDARFGGRCMVLRRGQYPSLSAMGLNDRVSSVRNVSGNARVDDRRYAPPPVVERDYRRRGNERLHEAEVTSVRAVVGPSQQRCWVEREQVQQDSGRAVANAVLGGILGHQVGSGQQVRRCENVPDQARPEFWDVTYNFRGREHRVQMNTPPGRTVTVNSAGEPRA